MLRTDAIAGAFKAICEEAESIKQLDVPDEVKDKLSTIVSIARHQNDIRNAPKGSCAKGHPA